jgi:hypothetical protein
MTPTQVPRFEEEFDELDVANAVRVSAIGYRSTLSVAYGNELDRTGRYPRLGGVTMGLRA